LTRAPNLSHAFGPFTMNPGPVDESIAMTNTLTHYLNFIWAGLMKHGQTGGIVPSQRVLIAKMIAPVPR
jgi:hypothetical protein